MHKAIANLFSNILSIVHACAALVLAAIVYAAFTSGGGGLVGGQPEEVMLFAAGAIISYVVIFGFISLIIRIHENQERIAKSQEEIADFLAEISEKMDSMPTRMAILAEERTVERTNGTISSPKADRAEPPLRAPQA
jgi:uncharacterized membrane protein